MSYDEINRTIPPEHISCDEIEHLMARLDALGTAVVDSSGIGYDP